MDFPVFQFVLLPCSLILRRPCSVSFTPSNQMFTYADEIPPELSLLQTEHSQLSQPLLVYRILQALNHQLLAGLAPVCPRLSCLREPRTELQICFIGAEYRGRINFLGLLAMLFLMQPKRLLTFFSARAHTVGLCSTLHPTGLQDPLLEHCLPVGWLE